MIGTVSLAFRSMGMEKVRRAFIRMKPTRLVDFCIALTIPSWMQRASLLLERGAKSSMRRKAGERTPFALRILEAWAACHHCEKADPFNLEIEGSRSTSLTVRLGPI
ncbi:hypothetical protein LZC95_19930 [Pendulispora brunnea]|uniref:Uncharacterized protein n=1 Tax=Pendulispora brunnea TaxID=2905690 RepID=A0ABZ2KLZ7_9BACT